MLTVIPYSLLGISRTTDSRSFKTLSHFLAKFRMNSV
nr:MAG TPA: hypothetical protein [Caudoviricetes sp.]